MDSEEWNGFVSLVRPLIAAIENDAQRAVCESMIELGTDEVSRTMAVDALKGMGIKKPRGGLNPEQQAVLIEAQAINTDYLNALVAADLLHLLDTPSRQGLTVADHQASWTRRVTKNLKDAAKAEDA
tara:strand:- start:81 stop:461 length:381 start_codon:yes stop_codon:yes gene_type:complete